MTSCRWLLLGTVLLGAITLAGCGERPKYDVKPQGLEQARRILTDYANGAIPGSEQMNFPEIVEEVKKTDAAKAATLEHGFAAITRNPRAAASQARALLKQL